MSAFGALFITCKQSQVICSLEMWIYSIEQVIASKQVVQHQVSWSYKTSWIWDEIANYCMSFLSEHASLQIESIWPLQNVYTIACLSYHLLLSSAAGFQRSILRSYLALCHQAQSRTNISMSAASILEIICYTHAVASRANPTASIKVGTIACAALKNLSRKKI